MSYSTKFLLILFIGILLSVGLPILAQEPEVSNDVTAAIDLDEDVQPADLEVGLPRILPDSPFYFLKEWGRGIQSFFTFNPVAKANLKSKFANEKLIEVKILVAKQKGREIIEKGIENYQREMEAVKRITERIKEKAEENEEVEKFLDKFTQHQLLHQRILQKLESQVPPEAFEKIKEAREKHLERFKDVMLKLEDAEKIGERLEKNMEKIKGSKYKNFRNLEVLLELEEKVPEEAREAIRRAQENALKRLQGDLEKMSPEDQEKFKEYLERIGGVKEKQLEILDNLKSELKEKPELKEKIIEIRERVMEKAREKLQKLNCPEIEEPALGFCQEGRIVIKRDERGCIISFECVIPAEIEIPSHPEKPVACITLWDPVCGTDGKTYSNACFAELAGAEIAYKGKCMLKECQTDADCPQPRCGPTGTISARCIGVKTKCIDGKCQIQSILLPVE